MGTCTSADRSPKSAFSALQQALNAQPRQQPAEKAEFEDLAAAVADFEKPKPQGDVALPADLQRRIDGQRSEIAKVLGPMEKGVLVPWLFTKLYELNGDVWRAGRVLDPEEGVLKQLGARIDFETFKTHGTEVQKFFAEVVDPAGKALRRLERAVPEQIDVSVGSELRIAEQRQRANAITASTEKVKNHVVDYLKRYDEHLDWLAVACENVIRGDQVAAAIEARV